MTSRFECDGTPCFSATEHQQECRYFEGERTIVVAPCERHTSTGCDHCRYFGDESGGLSIDPDEES